MRYEHLTILALALLGLPLYGRAQANKPTETTVCELRRNPGAWDHKLVRVKAYVTHGFEESSIVDPACGNYNDGSQIWMEYGGRVGSNTMYFGPVSPRHRPRDLQVESISLPLVEDARFKALDETLQRGAPDHGVVVVAATVEGHFFAGKRNEKRPSEFGGFGHFGCCSLFVLEAVNDVAEHPLTSREKKKFAEAFHLPPPTPPAPLKAKP